MSVVPSVNASSSSVLPTFFGATSSERPVPESGSGSSSTESGAGGPNTFSEALKQSTDPTHRAEPASSRGNERNRSESNVSADAIPNEQGNSEVVGHYLQTDLPLNENSLLTNPTDGLAATAHHGLDNGAARLLRNKSDADETASAVEGLQSTEVALPSTDSIAGAVVAIHIATQPNSQEATVVEDEADSELIESDVLQLNQKPEERDQSNSDAFNATNTKETTGEADLVAPSADLPSQPTSQLTSESLRQLRTKLETDFGVRPDRSRQLGNRANLQGGNLLNQVAQTNSQLGQRSQGIDPTVAASSSQFDTANNISSAVNPVGSVADPEAATLPVSGSPSDLSALEANGLPAETAQSQLSASTDRGEANGSLDPINRRSSAAKLAPNRNIASAAEASNEQVVDQSQHQASQPASVGRADVGAAEATVSRVASDSVLASTVTAGSANTKSADTDPELDADELQVDSISFDGGDIPQREAAKADAANTGRLHTPVDTRGSEYSGAAPSNAGSSNPVFSEGQSPSVDPESLDSTSATDDLPIALQPETTSVVDSDLDLLQQLLPRETSTPFGQSVGSAAGNLTDPTNLPRQIAARVLGEAEVLEAGDSTRFRMKLDPPELGSVMIEMQKSVQGTTITVTAADPATQQLLQDSLQQLNQSHADESSIFENLAFDLSNGDQGESQDHDTRKSQAQKLRIAGSDLGKTDSESASQTSTELDFVA